MTIWNFSYLIHFSIGGIIFLDRVHKSFLPDPDLFFLSKIKINNKLIDFQNQESRRNELVSKSYALSMYFFKKEKELKLE